jgi:hypothetical protein
VARSKAESILRDHRPEPLEPDQLAELDRILIAADAEFESAPAAR